MIKESRKTVWLGGALIVLLTMVAYFPTMRAGFIWDDDDHLTNNPAMLSVEGLKQIWSSLAVSRYYPLTLTSFWVQRHFWGLHPLPYHAVNIALHTVNAVLLWTLLRRLQVRGAWVAATLWALHPVNVETVAWVTELKNTQSGLFFLLALLVFLRFEDGLRPRDYVMALVCGAAAMLSKPSTVVLPGVMLLCAWWRRGRWTRRDFLRVTPLVVFGVGMSLLTIVEQRHRIANEGISEWTLTAMQRLALAGRAVWFYAGKLLWPADICFIYPRWELRVDSVMAWLPLVGLALVALMLWQFRRAGWARAASFGLGCFIVGLLPVLGFFDIFFFRYSFVADHFQYLASAGLIALVVSAGATIAQRAGRLGHDLGALVAAAVLLILGVSTWGQAHVYQDQETLWRDTLAGNPNAWIAHNNLGNVLADQGRIEEAIDEYRATLRIKPDHWGAHSNLANALFAQGKLADAITEYQVVLRAEPDSAEAHNDWGGALAMQGKIAEATAEFVAALRINPDFAEAHYNLGNALFELGKVPEAMAQYREALRLRPDLPPALSKLAWILATNGNADFRNGTEAVRLAERLCTVTGYKQAKALDVLAAACAEAGRFSDAVCVAQKAVESANAAGRREMAKQIQERLKLYQAGQPFHEDAAQ
ncbi:MAG: tetratricopeptide repeat protein, partial [Verrucomicrobiia bacterium]